MGLSFRSPHSLHGRVMEMQSFDYDELYEELSRMAGVLSREAFEKEHVAALRAIGAHFHEEASLNKVQRGEPHMRVPPPACQQARPCREPPRGSSRGRRVAPGEAAPGLLSRILGDARQCLGCPQPLREHEHAPLLQKLACSGAAHRDGRGATNLGAS
mmetsp:Transcript_62566/g.176477  ORF Transcript_62566/g.176477 Transcript_62566/m.176477 type:complete len:158 (+) Transcript_62566:36-509(+)